MQGAYRDSHSYASFQTNRQLPRLMVSDETQAPLLINLARKEEVSASFHKLCRCHYMICLRTKRYQYEL